MVDILDKLDQSIKQNKDILDALQAKSSPQTNGDAKLAKITSLKKTGSAPGAFLADIGATLNKIVPNMKRFVNPDDKEALAQIKEIESFQEILRTAYPSAVFGGEVALPGITAAATMGLGATPSIVAGITEAAGFSDSDQNPRTNAMIAGALPFVPDALKRVGGGMGEVFESVVGRVGDISQATPQQQAGRAIRRYVDETGVIAEDVLSKRGALGRGSTLADVQQMEGLSQGLALTPSGRSAMPFFEQRQLDQQGRIMDELSKITGKKANSFTGDLQSFIKSRAESAAPLYKEAFEVDFIPSENFKNLFSRLKGSGALKRATDIAKIEGRKINPESVNYSDLHAMKIGIDDLINAEMQKGASGKANALRALKSDLLNEIESNNPAYKMGRLQFSGDSGIINAAEIGASLFNPKKQGSKISFDQLKDEVSQMSSDEFTAFQGGMTKAVGDVLSGIPETADAARRLWSKPKVRESIKLAFENDDQFNRFLSSVEKETQFTDTLRKLFQGSMTAQRQAGQQALKTGDISALQPFKKILKGELTPEGTQELTRLMFDPKVTNDEIRKVMINSGVINETATSKAIAEMRRKWGSVWSRINLPGVSTPQKAAISSKIAQENEDK